MQMRGRERSTRDSLLPGNRSSRGSWPGIFLIARDTGAEFAILLAGDVRIRNLFWFQMSDLIRRNVRLKISQGLHIRACSNVISIVDGFPGSVFIINGDKRADASSMFDLLLLAAHPESDLVIEADGDGAEAIIDKLTQLFSTESDISG